MTLQKFSIIKINPDNFDEDVKILIEKIRPSWNISSLRIQKFSNGTSNLLYGVYSDDCFSNETDMVLVRINGRTLLNRDVEMENMAALSRYNLSANVFGIFGNGCSYQYIHGKVLTIEELRLGEMNSLIINEFVKFHTFKINTNRPVEPILFSQMKELVEFIPEYLNDAEKNKRYLSNFPSKLVLQGEIACLQKHLDKPDFPVGFCHNDLLVYNMILNLSKDRIHFIDFEYAGYNYCAFDIGNHFNEYSGLENVDYSMYPNEVFQKKWIRQYLEILHNSSCVDNIIQNGDITTVSDNEVNHWYKMINKFSLASHLIWCMWSIWQDVNSIINLNYLDYGIIRWNQYIKKKDELLSL